MLTNNPNGQLEPEIIDMGAEFDITIPEQIFPEWTGALIVTEREAIPNIRASKKMGDVIWDTENPPIPCYVTSMRTDSGSARGYTNMVTKMEMMFGNVIREAPAMELTIEFDSIPHLNRFMVACRTRIMASQAIVTGNVVHIIFGQWMLHTAIISDVSVNYLPGTLIGQAVMRIACSTVLHWTPGGDLGLKRHIYRGTRDEEFSYYRDFAEHINDDYLKPIPTQDDGDAGVPNPETRDVNEKSIISIDGGGLDGDEPRDLTWYVAITQMSITFRENIKILGAGTEITAYPRYATQIRVELMAPANPEATLRTKGMAALKYTSDIMDAIRSVIEGSVTEHGSVTISMGLYGDMVFLPTAAQMNYTGSHQASVDIGGLLQTFMQPAILPGYEVIQPYVGG